MISISSSDRSGNERGAPSARPALLTKMSIWEAPHSLRVDFTASCTAEEEPISRDLVIVLIDGLILVIELATDDSLSSLRANRIIVAGC